MDITVNKIDNDIFSKALIDKKRKETASSLYKFVKNKETAISMEFGIVEFTIEYCTIHELKDFMIDAIYNDRTNDILKNLNPKSEIFSKSLQTKLNDTD